MEASEHYIAIFDLVFSDNHSNGFKEAEIKDLITELDYCFLRQPKEGWLKSVKDYLNNNSLEWNIDHLDKWSF